MVHKIRNSLENLTNVCIDPIINREYVQLYFNSTILVELMKSLQKKLKSIILANEKFTIPFLRGVFAAEGSIGLKKSGVLFHASFPSKDDELIVYLKECLDSLGITHGKYMIESEKFPIYGRKNFERIKELGLHTLHPEKRVKFEIGFANYKRRNVMKGKGARALILRQFAQGPKTYDELQPHSARLARLSKHGIFPSSSAKGSCAESGSAGKLGCSTKEKISQCPIINRVPMRGTYVLLLHAPYDSSLKIGELGDISIKGGYYAYVGSALGGLEQRVRRHLTKEKKPRWHIDYLLTRAPVVDVIYASTPKRKECEAARGLAKDFPSIRGFGSSDCKCESHLFYSPDFHELLRHVILAFKACGLKPEKGVRYV